MLSFSRKPGRSHAPLAHCCCFFGLVGFAFTVVTIVAIVVYFDQVVRSEVVVKVEQTNVAGEYQAKMATWEGELSSYGWVDAQNGVVRIPFDRAAELVAQEYSQQR